MALMFFTFALVAPLFGVLFESPLTAAAIAGGAVSVPIIIHLLNRRRFKVVSWAAMRFLLAAQRKNSRRMRIEQLILLIIRCLILLLLVAAMISVTPWAEAAWRWAFPDAVVTRPGAKQRTHKILVIDGSLSMDLRRDGETCFAKAIDMAENVIRESAGADAFSVVLMSDPPRRIVAQPSDNPDKVIDELHRMQLPHGNGDLIATLLNVENLIQDSPSRYVRKEVYFFTDLQQSTWLTQQPNAFSDFLKKFDERTSGTYVLNVGGDVEANVSITDVRLMDDLARTGQLTTFLATLRSFGPETRDKVTVKWSIGKAREKDRDPPCKLHQKQEALVRLERGQQTPTAFSYKFEEPGEYVVRLSVENDDLVLDDVRTVVVRVRKSLPVMLVNGYSRGKAFDQSAKWLEFALNPPDDRAGSDLVSTELLSRAGWKDETQGDLDPFDCVFLCDVPTMDPAQVRRLEQHVRRGGGLIICLGENVQPDEYNRLLYRDGNGLMPVPLVGIQQATENYNFQLALEGDSDSTAPMQAFRSADDQTELLLSRFMKFYRVGETASGVKPRRVLSFVPVVVPGRETEAKIAKAPPGGPAILEWNPPDVPEKDDKEDEEAERPKVRKRMRGRVILLTTSANADWHTWPASWSYPALMNELAVYASSGRLQEQSGEVGKPLELFLAQTQSGVEATVRLPDDTTETKTTEEYLDASILRFLDTDLSGLYRVTLGQHTRERLFAVNVPVHNINMSSESDLTRTTQETLREKYPDWDIQVVTDAKDIEYRVEETASIDVIYEPLGTAISHWMLLVVLCLVFAEVVLAWHFAHYSTAAPLEESKPTSTSTWGNRILQAMPWLLFLFLLAGAFVLGHAAWTGDFLGFFPEGMRRTVEGWMDVPELSAGEDRQWRLEYSPYLWNREADLWLIPLLAIAGIALVTFIYRREGNDVSWGRRLLMGGLRIGLLLLLLAVFLPQLRLWFDREGWPEIVVLIDDSNSMSASDDYSDPKIKAMVEKLGQVEGLDAMSRLRIAQILLTKGENTQLRAILERRQFRLHVYRCSARAKRLEEVSDVDQIDRANEAVQNMQAVAKNDSSQLGTGVRQVLNDFRGSSLAAIVMYTDGVTTVGEDLISASKYASQMRVPLFFVGVGDAHDVRDLYLDNLRVEESVYVNDRIIFEFQVTAKGYADLSVDVTLHEKGKENEAPLDKKTVQTNSEGRPIKVRLVHQPKEPGEKTYVIKVPVQKDEVEKENNRLERQVSVIESKLIKVLYVEGYRRYEYHYLKTLLERESQRVKGNKTVELQVRLMESDADFADQDASARSTFPSKEELEGFDVVILGDVDPRPKNRNQIDAFFRDLVDFVTVKGGGLLLIAGEQYSPTLYKTSVLRDILPIEVTADPLVKRPDRPIIDTYQPKLTPAGRIHPIFRFSPDERENDKIWDKLRGMYWYSEEYVAKPAAEVLAVHPTKPREDAKDKKKKDLVGSGLHPLVVQQFVGGGRCMFIGFHETWRWGFREDMRRFNQFWIQMVRYLARSRLGSTRLWLDQQTPYRRGQPIHVFVRFPDDRPPPPEDTEVKVVAERRAPDDPTDVEVKTMELSKVEGSRATYEAVLSQTNEGEYRFWLSQPQTKPRPRAECKVVAPPGEMYGLRLNSSDLIRAAEDSGGRYYTIASADQLLEDLPKGRRVRLAGGGPPWLLWNHILLFVLALSLVTTEWLLRKQKNML